MRFSALIGLCKPEDPRAKDPEKLATWLTQNKENIIRISENTGCGCCILQYQIETNDSVESLPKELSVSTEWTKGEEFEGELSTESLVSI